MSIQTPFRHRSMEVNPRGGSFPLIAAVAERFRLVSINTNAPTATATIESQCFVQMWNPYTTPIVLNNQELRFVVRNRMLVSFGTAIVTPSMTTIRRSPLV